MNKFLIIFFFLGITLLLIGARFGFTWAGGEGHEEPMGASVKIISGGESASADLIRGSEVETKNDEYALIHIGKKIIVALDQRTIISMERLFPSVVEINLQSGRLLAKTSSETEKFIISSPYANGTITDDALTAVRYDFLNKTTFAPLGGEILVEIKNGPSLFSDEQAVDVNELNPTYSDFSDFNWHTSATADFYEWAMDIIQ